MNILSLSGLQLKMQGLPLTELCDRDSDCYNLLVEAGALQETKRVGI